MNNEIVGRILTQYGYQNYIFQPVEKGYRNETHPFTTPDGQTRNLILFKCEPGILETIQNADRSADFAAHAGLPVRQRIEQKTIRLQAGSWKKYGSVYTYLPGQTIPWEAYTQEHIKLLGKTMSDLHASLAGVPLDNYPNVADQYTAITRRVRDYFARSDVSEALAGKLKLRVCSAKLPDFTRVLLGAKRLDHQQVLHMDFVRSNILFSGARPVTVSGILDFEKTAVGHPVFDIARTLSFLLIDCKYKSEDQIRKYFLYSGYRRRGSQAYLPVVVKISGKRFNLLEVLLELFLLYDLYKFLRHNPYESLMDNEHFMRTKAFLFAHGLVEAI